MQHAGDVQVEELGVLRGGEAAVAAAEVPLDQTFWVRAGGGAVPDGAEDGDALEGAD